MGSGRRRGFEGPCLLCRILCPPRRPPAASKGCIRGVGESPEGADVWSPRGQRAEGENDQRRSVLLERRHVASPEMASGLNMELTLGSAVLSEWRAEDAVARTVGCPQRRGCPGCQHHIPAALVRVPGPQPAPWNRKGVPVWLHASLGLPLALGELACLCRAGTVGKCRGRTKVPQEEDAQRCSMQPPGGASGRHPLTAGLSLSLSPWASRGHQTNKYAHSSSCLRVCFRGNQNGTLRVHFLGRQEGLGCQGEEQGGSAAAADGKQSRRGTEGKRPCLVSRRRVLADAVFSVT